MIRGLLLLLIALTAALPPRVCLCGHHHPAASQHQHDQDDSEPSHHDGPCQCRHLPRDAAVPPRPTVEGGSGIETLFVIADAVPVRPAVPAPVFRSESPPGLHQSLPLYLSTARLLI